MGKTILRTAALLALVLTPAAARAELRRVDLKIFGMD
jgi:hypothetical protein